jgi:hypothetical protein
MFVRTTPTRIGATGKTYITHRLVESRRAGDKVRQLALLKSYCSPECKTADLHPFGFTHIEGYAL